MATSRITAIFSVAFLVGASAQHATAKSLVVQCNDSTKVQIRELYAESSMRYPLGDLIEVRLSNEPPGKSGVYRLAAASTGSFGGRWVYTGPPGPNFSLLLSGKSPVWYLDFDGQKPLSCARI
mgnify:FL=1